MTNIEDINVGDKVRVTYEGVVSSRGTHSFSLSGTAPNVISTHVINRNVEVVEKAKRQWKVGDALGNGDFESLPVGTVVQYQSGKGAVLKTHHGYITATGINEPTADEFASNGYVVVIVGESD